MVFEIRQSYSRGLALIILVALLCSSSNALDFTTPISRFHDKFADWRFKDFIEKFDPKTVIERMKKSQATKRANYSSAQYIDIVIEGLDETDELLKLNVQRIGGPIETTVDRLKHARRWQPRPGFSPYDKDPFDLRVRIYELMRQAIYQARNEMVIMQMMREKYRRSSLYKMGFLMCKTDNAIKVFSQFAFRIFRQCGLTRSGASTRIYLYDTLLMEERLLSLWFNAQLLTDLVIKNDDNLKDLLEVEDEDRNKKWKFVD